MTSKVITVFSNKGGVGKTFVAVNIAAALTLKGKKVLAIDLDLQAGQNMARMFSLTPAYSLADALTSIKDNEGAQSFKKFITSHSSGLDFLPAVNNLGQSGHITADNIRHFFKQAISSYDYIIVDADKSFSDTLISVLDNSNMILLITTPDILAVYQAKNSLEILQSLHFPLKMIKVVVNRAESRGSVAWQEVQTALGCPIFSLLPSDGKTVGLALNRGIPCVIDSPKVKISEDVFQLADKIQDESIYVPTTDVIKVRAVDNKAVSKNNVWERFGITPGSSPVQASYKKEEDVIIKLKKSIHQKLIERMNIKKISTEVLMDQQQAVNIRKAAEKVVTELLAEMSGSMLSSHEERARIVREIVNEAVGLGPLEDFLADQEVTDIMVNNKDDIFVEKNGKIVLTNKHFVSNEQVRAAIDRIIAPLGRRIDESNPMVDARLPDGSRINAIIPPLSLNGPMITIRKFAQDRYTIDDLLNKFNTISQPMVDFINACVIGRKNIVVSGGTGAGKTTLLNIVSQFIPDNERIITIEDAAELKLVKTHWVRLESRPANIEGRGKVQIRDLFVNTLRMRPDRIIIGECRGSEALDMLQAMNTGHDGSLTTLHANTPRDVMSRLASMVLLSGIELPIRAIYEMTASAINVIIQINRFSDGSRKITAISELSGKIIDGMPEIMDIFIFKNAGINSEGKILGEYIPTGYIPKCYEDLNIRGIPMNKNIFSPKQAS